MIDSILAPFSVALASVTSRTVRTLSELCLWNLLRYRVSYSVSARLKGAGVRGGGGGNLPFESKSGGQILNPV